uniref:Uncharacterized protein n=1 Tax=Schistosoma mansoni TaxID=6183 RepID=A0A5K4FB66_SCHMA
MNSKYYLIIFMILLLSNKIESEEVGDSSENQKSKKPSDKAPIQAMFLPLAFPWANILVKLACKIKSWLSVTKFFGITS